MIKRGRSNLFWSRLCRLIGSMQQHWIAALDHVCWCIDAFWWLCNIHLVFSCFTDQNLQMSVEMFVPSEQTYVTCSLSASSHRFLHPCSSKVSMNNHYVRLHFEMNYRRSLNYSLFFISRQNEINAELGDNGCVMLESMFIWGFYSWFSKAKWKAGQQREAVIT